MATKRAAATQDEQGETAWGVPVPGSGRTIVAPQSDTGDETPELEPGEKISMLLRGGISDDAQVRVYRRKPKSTGYEWCKNYSAAEFLDGDLEMIRNEWGPGEYSMRIYGLPGVNMQREDVTISAPVNVNPIIATAAQNAQQSELSQALIRIAEQSAMQNAALLAAINTKPDPMENMMQMMTLAKSMREAFGVGVGGASVSQSPAPAPVSMVQQITEMAAAVRTFKDVAKEMGGEETSDPENPMSIFSQILDTVKIALPNMAQRQSVAQEQQAIQPMLIPESVNNASQQEEPGMLLIKGTLAGLLSLKNNGGTVEQGGAYIAEKISDELIPHLDNPNWFQIACSFAPELKPHEEWVKAATARAVVLLADNPGP